MPSKQWIVAGIVALVLLLGQLYASVFFSFIPGYTGGLIVGSALTYVFMKGTEIKERW